jgi:hypothetical protein
MRAGRGSGSAVFGLFYTPGIYWLNQGLEAFGASCRAAILP